MPRVVGLSKTTCSDPPLVGCNTHLSHVQAGQAVKSAQANGRYENNLALQPRGALSRFTEPSPYSAFQPTYAEIASGGNVPICHHLNHLLRHMHK